MKIVKQKHSPPKSPNKKKTVKDVPVEDVSDVDPEPNTGHTMIKLNLKFETLEDILERFQN